MPVTLNTDISCPQKGPRNYIMFWVQF